MPVLTLADSDQVLTSGEYARKVAIRMIEILDEIDLYRGTGRLYLP